MRLVDMSAMGAEGRRWGKAGTPSQAAGSPGLIATHGHPELNYHQSPDILNERGIGSRQGRTSSKSCIWQVTPTKTK